MTKMTEDFNRKPNRLAQRSIAAYQSAMLELLEEKPFQKITITDLANRSGMTRSTFYAHFETKEELLQSIINNILDDSFEQLRDFKGADSSAASVLENDKYYFKVWEKNRSLVKILNTVDFHCLLVNRLKDYFGKLYTQNVMASLPEIQGNYSSYTISFLANSFAGFLEIWIQNDMYPSAEVMGEMLYHFTGQEAMLSAREKFRHKFTPAQEDQAS